MTSNTHVLLFLVKNRTSFEQQLHRVSPTSYCTWAFYRYNFSKLDVPLIQQLTCGTLSLWESMYRTKLRSQSLRQKVLSAFLSLRGVEKLIVNMMINKSLFALPDLHRFVYRSPISQSLKTVYIYLPKEFDLSLAKGLEYALGITSLKVSFNGAENVKYVHRYFRSANLRDIEFRNVAPEDCVALMREKRNKKLNRVVVLNDCVWNSELVSKYVSGMLLKEPAVTIAANIIATHSRTALSNHQKHLFKIFDITSIL